MVSASGGSMSLKQELVGSCLTCHGTGFLDHIVCDCLKKFRIYNRLVSKGFTKKSLDIICRDSYVFPEIDSGEKFIEYFVNNPDFVEDNGLSLYLYSKERGRGKTTLAHYIMYNVVKYFFEDGKYQSFRNYGFIHAEDFLEQLTKSDDSMWKSSWLVLDDLGNENLSADWNKTAMLSGLQRVLHYRRDKCLPTIITSNYAPSSLSVKYKQEVDSLLEIKADGHIGGAVFREVEVGGGEDLRLVDDYTSWPI